MRYHPFNRFLCSEASELTTGGGATAPEAPATPPAAAPAAEATTPPSAAASPREPSRLEKIHAVFRDKGALLAESATLRTELEQVRTHLGERDAAILTLQGRINALETENSQLTADFQSIDAALKTTEAKVVTTDEAAARQIAGMGFEAAALPAAETAATDVNALIARMNATNDPVEKFNLAARINKIEAEN